MSALANPLGFTQIQCCTCRVPFCMTNDMYRARKSDHTFFYCPAGHPQHYRKDESAEKNRIAALEADLERERQATARERSSRQWAESRAKGANIQAGKAKAAKRRLEQRVAHGVCPCCQRTFKQLAAHMETKHPDWKTAK